jgi:hypothetical protein
MKDELLSEISELEMASRGLFEEDDAFEERLVASRNRKVSSSSANKAGGLSKAAPGGKGKSSGTGSRSANSSGGGGSAWQTPGGSAAGRAALGGKNATAVKSKPKSGGGVFAAMMIDSDSDSD